MKTLRAILTSDWHMSHNAPTARSAELSWYDVQARAIVQLKHLQLSSNGHPDIPIVIAGDLFHTWRADNSPPELVNFLLEILPENVWAIPGQHDLPEHRWEGMHRTPFETLVRAGKINLITPEYPVRASGEITLHGFPWGFPMTPLIAGRNRMSQFHVAVVHAYVWKTGSSYPNAPADAHIAKYRPILETYDAAVFGDNHMGFTAGGRFINAGTLIRRRRDEMDYKPQVGLLYETERGLIIEPHYLDQSADVWSDVPEAIPSGVNVNSDGFVGSLRSAASSDSLDFREAVRQETEAAGADENVRREIELALP